MSDNELKIRRAAAAEKKWSEGDVEVKPFGGIELQPCRFYAASHKTQPTSDVAVYALLPNGAIASQAEETAIDKILAACDPARASAKTWAELLARFHWKVRPGKVLLQAEPPIHEGDPPKPFAPPALTEGTPKTVRFYLRNVETMKLYEVTAVLEGRKVGAVTKKVVE